MKNKALKSTSLSSSLIIIAGCLWGTTGLFINVLNGFGLTSMEIGAMRSVITAVLILAFLLIFKRNLLKIKLKDIWCFIGTGIVSVLIFNFFYFKTIVDSSMSFAATLLYTSPSFVMLLSAILFKEKLTRRKITALIVSFIGCVLVTGVLSGSLSFGYISVITGIASGLFYALYSIFSRYALQKGYHSLTITAYTFIFSAIGGIFIVDVKHVASVCFTDIKTLLFCILYALITTVFTYTLYTLGLKNIENGKAAVIAAVEPVTATVLGMVFLEQVPSIMSFIGIFLVLFSIYLLADKKH